MRKEIPKLSDRLCHYRVPEGYFDNLSPRILSRIPWTETAPHPGQRHKSRRRLLEPWWGIAAAAVAGVAALFVFSEIYGDRRVAPEEAPVTADAQQYAALTDDEYAEYMYESCLDLLVQDTWGEGTEVVLN